MKKIVSLLLIVFGVLLLIPFFSGLGHIFEMANDDLFQASYVVGYAFGYSFILILAVVLIVSGIRMIKRIRKAD